MSCTEQEAREVVFQIGHRYTVRVTTILDKGEGMPLQRSEVEHIAVLARIGLTDAEVELFGDQLSHILEQFEVLRQLDTSGVLPTGRAGELQTVMRDDDPGDGLTTEEVLSNAPRTEGKFIRVKPVLEG
jgi:aspartyl-tRNA(Asn)/glutamyl-tRNA(Gln) amidotransferase subunit C